MKKYITSFLSTLLLAGMVTVTSQTAFAEEVAVPTLYSAPSISSDVETETVECVPLTYTLRLSSKDKYTKGEVTKLQNFLIKQGLLTGTSTGYFGYSTRDAVKKFQSRNGLTVVGLVGPQTRVAIKNISACSNGSSTVGGGTTIGTVTTDSRCIGSLDGIKRCTTTTTTCPAPGRLVNGACDMSDEVPPACEPVERQGTGMCIPFTPQNSVTSLVKQKLALKLGVPYSIITLIGSEKRTWNDGCLGVVTTKTFCAMGLVEGYLVKVSYGGVGYVYHTNGNGTVIIENLSSSAPLTGNIEVTSPNVSSVIKMGDVLNLAWKASQSKVATTTLIISLEGAVHSFISFKQPTSMAGDGTYAWTVPESVISGDVGVVLPSSGKYTIKATLYEGAVTCLGFCMDPSRPRIIASDESPSFTIQSKVDTTETKDSTRTQSSAPVPAVLGVSIMCTDLPRNLHRGMESVTVSFLQSFLLEKGFLEGEATGFYGDNTVDAVKAYQSAKDLPVTGMVYDFTREAIRAETCQ